MRIIRLELRGYIRLGVCNIDHLIYTPESNYQLILGTNGSGKSSLIYELSPLPAHHSQYTKDGLKHITIEHRGATYQLISDFKTGKHSFSIDGDENLNRGGTQQVQRRHIFMLRHGIAINPGLVQPSITDSML